MAYFGPLPPDPRMTEYLIEQLKKPRFQDVPEAPGIDDIPAADQQKIDRVAQARSLAGSAGPFGGLAMMTPELGHELAKVATPGYELATEKESRTIPNMALEMLGPAGDAMKYGSAAIAGVLRKAPTDAPKRNLNQKGRTEGTRHDALRLRMEDIAERQDFSEGSPTEFWAQEMRALGDAETDPRMQDFYYRAANDEELRRNVYAGVSNPNSMKATIEGAIQQRIADNMSQANYNKLEISNFSKDPEILEAVPGTDVDPAEYRGNDYGLDDAPTEDEFGMPLNEGRPEPVTDGSSPEVIASLRSQRDAVPPEELARLQEAYGPGNQTMPPTDLTKMPEPQPGNEALIASLRRGDDGSGRGGSSLPPDPQPMDAELMSEALLYDLAENANTNPNDPASVVESLLQQARMSKNDGNLREAMMLEAMAEDDAFVRTMMNTHTNRMKDFDPQGSVSQGIFDDYDAAVEDYLTRYQGGK